MLRCQCLTVFSQKRPEVIFFLHFPNYHDILIFKDVLKLCNERFFMTRADLILHPIRMRVIIALTDRKLTPKQLAAELKDVAPATLYHHLNLLTDAGITRIVEERLVRGTLHEKVYTLSDASTILSPDQIAGASKDELLRYFLVFASKLIGDHARYLNLKESGYYADAGYQQHAVFLSDE